jgi:hypothetical protein
MQPTANPTLLTLDNNDGTVFELSGDDSHPLRFALSNLGFTNRTGPMYLSVAVYPTNYENSANQWATVKLNGNVIAKYCTPDQSCGDRFFPCVSYMDVSRNVSGAQGGSLLVEVSSSGVKAGPCDYQGYPLHARVFLSESLPPPSRDSLTIWVVVATVLFIFLVLVFAAWYCCSTKNKHKSDAYESESDNVASTAPHMSRDPEANVARKPVASARSPQRRSVQVVPAEEQDAPVPVNKEEGQREEMEPADVGEKDLEAGHDVQQNSKSLLAQYELDE